MLKIDSRIHLFVLATNYSLVTDDLQEAAVYQP